MEATELATSIGIGAGILLALAFDYFPGLNTWFGKLTKNAKRLIMLALLFVVSLIALAAACTGLYGGVTCDNEGVMLLVKAFVDAVIANQATYLITPKPKKVEAVKAAR